MSRHNFFGGIGPVAQRELREGARRPVNHRLRFLSAGVGTLLLWRLVANSKRAESVMGIYLLGSFHALMLGLIFLIAPALTADGIAREKREGTLGLLFLTPLSAGGIVAGKALVQALRALTLWLAVLPILIIPFMMGGVTWFDALTAVSLEFCAAVLCLAAGLLASSLAQERNTVFLLAYVFGAIFLFLFTELFLLVLFVGYPGPVGHTPKDFLEMTQESLPFLAGLELEGIGWQAIVTGVGFAKLWESLCLVFPLVVLLFFFLAARFAARRVERSWQDKIPSARRESLLRRFCTPLFQQHFRRKMQRTLDWNPIAWLQQYSWKARLSKWGLCLAFLLIECAAGAPFNSENFLVHWVEILTLGGMYTFAGVSGFLEEKRSGALELLLVTPISANQLIFGRVWGLWKQFLPASLVLAGSYAGWLWNHASDWANDDALMGPFILGCLFLTLPVFATYFALRVKNLIVAGVLTWVALFIPAFFVQAASDTFFGDLGPVANMIYVAEVFFSYAAFALLACSLLRHSLSRRIYSF